MEQHKSTSPASTLFVPSTPTSIKETGLSLSFLTDLALKIMYSEGNISGYELAERMRLPYPGVVDQVLEFLKREKLCAVKGTGGFAEAAYQYAIADKGRIMAREALDRSQYAGPAPVTLEAYTEAIHRQPLGKVVVHQRTMRQALAHMVISEESFAQLGPAVNSGRSIFLFGHPGNGKTAIAESIGQMMLGDVMYIPYAMEVGGHVIRIFDYVNHVLAEDASSTNRAHDPRWMRIQRPVIVTGGELTLETLDLVYDENNKYYEAPFQVKANGGMLLIDDFGRQQARPRDLVDEAFLRRIRHKIEVKDPTWDEYREIFRRVCGDKGVPYDGQGLAYLIQEHYLKRNHPRRACHPRDIVDQIRDIARYLNVPPALSKDLIDRACNAYFVEI